MSDGDEKYPDRCIRGIVNEQFIYSDGQVGSHAFFFDSPREDGWRELSVNWEDDACVIAFTLNQTKEDGRLLFRTGVAVLPRHEIDGLAQGPHFRGKLSYERQPQETNPYHGNILLREVSDRSMKQSLLL